MAHGKPEAGISAEVGKLGEVRNRLLIAVHCCAGLSAPQKCVRLPDVAKAQRKANVPEGLILLTALLVRADGAIQHGQSFGMPASSHKGPADIEPGRRQIRQKQRVLTTVS